MRTRNTIVAIEMEGETVELYVEYHYHGGSTGARDSLGGVRGAGPPLEPDEPEWCEILAVKKDKDSDDIFEQLSQKQVEAIEAKCLDEESSHWEDC